MLHTQVQHKGKVKVLLIQFDFCLVRGPRFNALFAGEARQLSALLDWEMAFVGDPVLDLASLYISDLRAHAGQSLPALPGPPDRGELIALYETATSRPVEGFHYNEIFATFWRGAVLVKILKDMRAGGAAIPESMLTDNFPTQHLRRLLGLG